MNPDLAGPGNDKCILSSLRFAVLLVALSGCGTGTSLDGPDAGPPTLEIGTGERTFETLPTDDAGAKTINAYMGPQGGFHVYLSLRATSVDPGSSDEAPSLCTDPGTNPCIAFTVTDLTVGRELDSFIPQHLPLTSSPDFPGAYELDPTRLVMMSITSLDDVDGHMLHVTVTLDGTSGGEAVQLADDATARCTPVRP